MPDSPPNVDDLIATSRLQARSGRFAESLRTLELASRKLPGYAPIPFARAFALLEWRRFIEIVRCPEFAVANAAAPADDALTVGWANFLAGDVALAEAWIETAMAAAPGRADLHAARASMLWAQRRKPEAIAEMRRALECAPGDIECEARLGTFLAENNDARDAEAIFRHLLETDSDNPQLWLNLGVTLSRQGRHTESTEAFERALRCPGFPHCDYVSVAIQLRERSRADESISILERRLPMDPGVDGHYSYSLSLLAAGRLAEGWHQYRFRWMREPSASTRSRFSVPPWSGQSLQGKTLLIACEQGFGDSIQFARYARLAKDLGANVVMQVQRGLHELAAGFEAVDRVLDPKGEEVGFDFHIDMMSLPAVFQTEVSTIPQHMPYVHVDVDRTRQWQARLSQPGMNIGLAWAGSPAHLADRSRSMKLDELRPLLQVKGANFFSLQKGGAEKAIGDLGLTSELDEIGSQLNDFADTAAFINGLDLVICVDTAVAHLAGALAKPVWLLVARPADWRWLEDRDDTPWYPTMRLFRQGERGNWGEVIERVREALEERVKLGVQELAVERPFVPRVPALPRKWVAGETKWPGHRRGLSAVIDTRLGLVQYLPDEPVIGDAIGWYGEHLQSQLDWLSRFVRPGSVVLEAVAGTGLHTLGLARMVGAEGHLLVYEDDATKRQILSQNMTLHKVGWVTLMQRRLGAIAEAQSVDVPPREESLDDLQLERLDWLKVNEGGRALEVLEGGEATAWRLRPKLVLAAPNVQVLDSLIARAKDLGYRCWVHEAPLYNPQNFNRREGDIFGGRVAITLCAIPEEIDADADMSECRHIP
jgi:tetratricopeptide (TPR) repeat protein